MLTTIFIGLYIRLTANKVWDGKNPIFFVLMFLAIGIDVIVLNNYLVN